MHICVPVDVVAALVLELELPPAPEVELLLPLEEALPLAAVVLPVPPPTAVQVLKPSATWQLCEVQSAPEMHFFPSVQRGHIVTPPQSTSVSPPSCMPFSQIGGGGGMRQVK